MELGDIQQKTNPVFVLVVCLLGLTAVFENGFRHEIIYYGYFATVPLALYYLLGTASPRKFLCSLNYPLLIFVGVSGLSLLWTVNINETLSEFYKIFFYLLLYYLVSTRISIGEVSRLVQALLIIGAFLALTGILLFLFVKSGRITSLFMNCNPFGMYLAMLSLVGLGIYGSRGGKGLFLILVLICDAMVLTGSRGSLIAWTISFPLIWLGIPYGKKREALGRLAVLFLMIALSVFLISSAAPWLQDKGWQSDTLERLVVRDAFQSSTSVAGRLSFWQTAWKMIEERPWTGFGLGSYHLVYNSFRNADHYWSLYTHNHYLQTWAETGLISLLALIIFFALFFIRIFKNGPGDGSSTHQGIYWGLAAGALAFLLHLSIDFTWNMPAVTMHFWCFLGLILVLRKEGTEFFSPVPRQPVLRTIAGLVLVIFFLGSAQQFLAFKTAQWGEKREAEEDFLRARSGYALACRIYPWRVEYQRKLADTYLVLSRIEGKKEYVDLAINHYRTAVKLSPYDYFSYQMLGRVLWQEKRAGAEEYLVQAVNLAGFKPEPYNDLGYYYLTRGEDEKAVEVLEKGAKERPFAWRNAPNAGEKDKVLAEGIKMHLGLARAYEELKLATQAQANLHLVLDLDPEHPVALREIEKYRREIRLR
ncbi:MAG: O-antigen ligase family protein [Bacillota bacterium]|jgi:O-antigen ligase/Flp pilus assembly protein TadD